MLKICFVLLNLAMNHSVIAQSEDSSSNDFTHPALDFIYNPITEYRDRGKDQDGFASLEEFWVASATTYYGLGKKGLWRTSGKYSFKSLKKYGEVLSDAQLDKMNNRLGKLITDFGPLEGTIKTFKKKGAQKTIIYRTQRSALDVADEIRRLHSEGRTIKGISFKRLRFGKKRAVIYIVLNAYIVGDLYREHADEAEHYYNELWSYVWDDPTDGYATFDDE
jgi:hypothetical protein